MRLALLIMIAATGIAADRPVVPYPTIPLLDMPAQYPAAVLAVAPDGSWAALHRWPYPATGTPPLIVQFWDLKTGTLNRSVPVSGNRIGGQFLSPDGRQLLLRVERGEKHVCVVIDTTTGRQVSLPETVTSALGFSADSTQIYGYITSKVGEEARIGVWSIATGEKVREFGIPDINRVTLGPDGKTAIVRTSKSISNEIWDFEKGRRVSTLAIKGETKLYHNDFLCFAEGCRKVVMCWNDDMRIFDAVTGELERTAKVPKAARSSSVKLHGISDDLSTVMATTYEGEPAVFELGKDQWRFMAPTIGANTWPVLTRDGKQFLRVHPAYGVEVFDAASGKRLQTLRPDTQHVRALAFAADGKTLLAGLSNDPRQRMSWEPEDPPAAHLLAWDPASGELKKAVAGLDAGVCNVFPTADGTKAVVSTGKHWSDNYGWWPQRADLWDLAAGKRLKSIAAEGDEFYGFTGSSDGRRLAAVRSEKRKTGDHYSVYPVGTRIWSLATGERELDHAAAPDSYVAALTPDGERLLTLSRKGAVDSWGVESGKSRNVFTRGPPSYKSKDNGDPFMLVALASGDSFIAMLGPGTNIRGPVQLYTDNRKIAFGKIDIRPGPLAVSLDGKWAAASERPYVGPARVFVWKVPDPPPLDEKTIKDGVFPAETAWVEPIVLHGHTGQIHAQAFSPDGRTLATGGEDCAIRLWDVPTGRLKLTVWAPPSAHPRATPTDWVAFTPDGCFAGTTRGIAFLRMHDSFTALGFRIPIGSARMVTANDPLYNPAKVRAALGGK